MLLEILVILFIILLNAIGFMISCYLFNIRISFLEAVWIQIKAIISLIIYELIVIFIPLLIVIYYELSQFAILVKVLGIIAGMYGYFKAIKNSLRVSWGDAIIVSIIGNIITFAIVFILAIIFV